VIRAALGKEWREQWRTARLGITMLVFLVFGLLSPVLAKLTPELLKLMPGGEAFVNLIPPPTMADAVQQYVKNISQFGVILALLLAMGAVAQEKDRGTAALILAKPMTRAAFLGAKFVSLALTFLLSLAVAAGACYYYTAILFGPLGLTGWLTLNLLLWLFVLVHIALTLLCSVLSRSQAAAGGLAFAAVVLLAMLGSIPRVGEHLPSELLVWGARSALGDPRSSGAALAVSLAIVLLSVMCAWLILERQEI
jgi:ABC-2 type transport system permease protein